MKIFLLLTSGLLLVLGQESQQPLHDFIYRNIHFSAELYKKLLKSNPGNFMVCPMSAEVILALAHSGARGNTAKQLSTGLRLPDDAYKVQDIFRRVIPTLNVNGKYILTSANKMYLADRFRITNQFNNTAVNVFDAKPEIINFLDNEQAAAQINQWVEQKTLNKIKDLVKPSYLTANTVAVLVNAMYFKGTWVNQFDAKITKKQPFHVGGNKVDAEMMTTVAYYNYFESKELGAQFLEMPYEGDDITMTIVLPFAKDGLSALEARLDEVLVAPRYRDSEVTVVIPKFKIETDVPLKPILEQLGIVDAFTRYADFSGMGGKEDPIHISEVLQKTFIEVHESGTTAAASTAVLFIDKSIPGHVFNANHPFLFFLKHRISGILFIGRVVSPTNV